MVLDLRAVPVVLVTLEYGLLQGLSVAAAILSVRYLQGDSGVVPGALALLFVTLVAGGARWGAGLTLKGLAGRRLYWAALLCLPYPLTLLMLPGGEVVFARLAAPLVLMNAAGLLLCVSVLEGRFHMLRATRLLTQQAERDALTTGFTRYPDAPATSARRSSSGSALARHDDHGYALRAGGETQLADQVEAVPSGQVQVHQHQMWEGRNDGEGSHGLGDRQAARELHGGQDVSQGLLEQEEIDAVVMDGEDPERRHAQQYAAPGTT